MQKGNIYIGTSGWSNTYWRGSLYPEKSKPADFLSLYEKTFNATEINSTFYHLPLLKTVEKWTQSVRPEFKFCVKMSRYITHINRLAEPEESLKRFIDILHPAKKMLGPVLVQLPPSLKFDYENARHFFDLLKHYNGYRFAIEARHPTWTEKDSINLLRKYGISWVIAESGGRYPYAEYITASNVYLRFHGPEKLFDSSYSTETLRTYAVKIKQWQSSGNNVWIFFNNTMHNHALNNSRTLMELLHIKKQAQA